MRAGYAGWCVFIPLLFELRKRKVKVGLQEAMALARALAMNLHDTSLDGFYHVARALCVHTEADLDAFDEAFLACFRGVEAKSLDLVKELEEWLSDPRARREPQPVKRRPDDAAPAAVPPVALIGPEHRLHHDRIHGRAMLRRFRRPPPDRPPA